jgi:class 3 adenylate cyclase
VLSVPLKRVLDSLGNAEHRWESEPVRVRIGIHAGEPVVTDNLYAGLDVHRAAQASCQAMPRGDASPIGAA